MATGSQKKRQAFQDDQFQETQAFLKLAREQLALTGAANLPWLDAGLRAALLADGRTLLEKFLNQEALHLPDDVTRAGERCYAGRQLTCQSVFGSITLTRNYYRHAGNDQSRCPLDAALGLVGHCTPALARMMCRAGSLEPFEAASQSLAYYAGVPVEGRRIQRLINEVGPAVETWVAQLPPPKTAPAVPVFYVEADGTGVPMRKGETQGRRGKQPDGSAKGREVKLGCVFTQHGVDEEGFPLRDPDTTSYIASFAGAKAFGAALRAEALHRGIAGAAKIAFLGDGAAWVWEMARVNFPLAIGILDLYHAAEHLTVLTEVLYGKDTSQAKAQFTEWLRLFKEDKEGVATVLRQARAALPKSGKRRKQAQKQIHYFQKNQTRMRYVAFREQGLFIGSGVVEAGCKTTVGQRVKQSGMFWKVAGSQNVLSTRCAIYSRRYEPYWEQGCQRKNPEVSLTA